MASEWYRGAAEQGDPDAALYPARMKRDGVGVPCNPKPAKRYNNQTAEVGLPEAIEEPNALKSGRH